MSAKSQIRWLVLLPLVVFTLPVPMVVSCVAVSRPTPEREPVAVADDTVLPVLRRVAVEASQLRSEMEVLRDARSGAEVEALRDLLMGEGWSIAASDADDRIRSWSLVLPAEDAATLSSDMWDGLRLSELKEVPPELRARAQDAIAAARASGRSTFTFFLPDHGVARGWEFRAVSVDGSARTVYAVRPLAPATSTCALPEDVLPMRVRAGHPQ